MRGSPVVSHTSRIPRFGARCWLRWVRRSDLGWSPLPPSFLSSSPAKQPGRRGTDRQGNKRRVGAARSRRRGHGPARLDGQAPAATVAESAMKEGKTDTRPTARGATNPRPRGERPRVPQARLAGGRQARAARIGTMRWPIRRRLVGGIEGRQACAAGIGFSQSPGEP